MKRIYYIEIDLKNMHATVILIPVVQKYETGAMFPV
jgi:hypothetical protein